LPGPRLRAAQTKPIEQPGENIHVDRFPAERVLTRNRTTYLSLGHPQSPPLRWPRFWRDNGNMGDPYVSGLCRWWHLRTASPELVEAESAGVLGAPGVVVDLGCGLGSEVGYLAGRGWRALGVDQSAPALSMAAVDQPAARFALADVTRLPLRSGSIDLLIDRGCFHYLGAEDRARYAREAARVLRADGRLMLRMCLTSAGLPNGLDERTVSATFRGWRQVAIRGLELASDTRKMPAVLAILIRSDNGSSGELRYR
jgi:SAM-dependent methyltransferase